MTEGYHRGVRLPPLFFLCVAFACSERAEVRGQEILTIDTDLPVEPGGLAVATVDTLRVDVYAPGANDPRETRELAIGQRATWPLSLGVVGPARIRLRLFAARWSSIAGTSSGGRERVPRTEVTIDRLIDFAGGAREVRRVRVLLTGDCMGREADLVRGRTCESGQRLDQTASDEVQPDDGQPTRAGTWPALAPSPCSGADDPERPCIPGGFDVLGDATLVGVQSEIEQPLPLRPVVVSPFRMDRAEYTVGRYRALLRSGHVLRSPAPRRADASQDGLAYCTFRGNSDATADTLPLNCVAYATAQELCAADGGRLATEAEWEHAASGRGEGRLFPWGNATPSCCTVSLSRSPAADGARECTASLPEPVGSHDGRACASAGGPLGEARGDVSRDGVLDLGGSLFEYTADLFSEVRVCALPGVQRDPVCTLGTTATLKSADWTAGFSRARVALRTSASSAPNSTQGFRCVSPEAP